MKWEVLLGRVADEPVFSSALLMTPEEDRADVQKQLSRWSKAGKLLQLRRGVYALAPPYRKTLPSPFLTANYLKRGSYVSLQSALAHHGLIPESVPEVTSVTTGRPEKLSTPLGRFSFRHVRKSMFHGYERIEVAGRQEAFVATAEKSLLDLVYLTPGSDKPAYLEELRLQNLESLVPNRLVELARRSGSPKMVRAVNLILEIAEAEEFEPL
jgi:predicted transcriptional regulator of viral defense system